MATEDQEKQKSEILLCPFCKGEFSTIPAFVKIFDCGWCSNRLVVVEDVPALYWKNFFSQSAMVLSYLFMANPETLVMRKIVPFGDSLKENQKNLFVVFEMAVICVVYMFFSLYIKSYHNDLLIFTHPIFLAIPMGIGVYYFVVYTNRRLELLKPDIPVFRPDFRE